MNIATLSFGGYNLPASKLNKNNRQASIPLSKMASKDVFFGNSAPDAVEFYLEDVIQAFELVAMNTGKSSVNGRTEFKANDLGNQARETVDQYLPPGTVAEGNPLFQIYKAGLILVHLVQLLDRRSIEKIDANHALALLAEEYPSVLPAIDKGDLSRMLDTAGYPSRE